MFEYLSGDLVELSDDDVVIEVGGIGYRARISHTTAEQLGPIGRTTKLWTFGRLRDEQWLLFGFATREERELFESICGISSVGPSIALALLSGIPLPEFLSAISEGNARALERVKGVGRKTAERICLELRDKVGAWSIAAAAGVAAPSRGSGSGSDDAVAALVSIGFAPSDAADAVQRIKKSEPDASLQEIIRAATRG